MDPGIETQATLTERHITKRSKVKNNAKKLFCYLQKLNHSLKFKD